MDRQTDRRKDIHTLLHTVKLCVKSAFSFLSRLHIKVIFSFEPAIQSSPTVTGGQRATTVKTSLRPFRSHSQCMCHFRGLLPVCKFNYTFGKIALPPYGFASAWVQYHRRRIKNWSLLGFVDLPPLLTSECVGSWRGFFFIFSSSCARINCRSKIKYRILINSPRGLICPPMRLSGFASINTLGPGFFPVDLNCVSFQMTSPETKWNLDCNVGRTAACCC